MENYLFNNKKICCSMAPGFMVIKNSANLKFWDLENGYGDRDVGADFPIRVVDSGRSAALDIALMLNDQDFEYQCRGFDQGFRVIVNNLTITFLIFDIIIFCIAQNLYS